MLTQKLKPTTIEDYIIAAPITAQDKLIQLHKCILKAAPGAVEGMKWRMPAYAYKKILVTFAVYKKHIGFYPMPSALKAFAKELSKYNTGDASVQFPLDKPLPLSLITKIVKFRVKESEGGVMRWRS